MTDAGRLVEINARHWMVGGAGTVYPEQCVCGLAWPCDAAFLLAELAHCEQADADSLAEVERLRGVVAKLEGFIETSAGKATSVGGAGVYPCPKDGTVLALLQGGAWCPVCHTVWRQTDEVALAELEAKP